MLAFSSHQPNQQALSMDFHFLKPTQSSVCAVNEGLLNYRSYHSKGGTTALRGGMCTLKSQAVLKVDLMLVNSGIKATRPLSFQWSRHLTD